MPKKKQMGCNEVGNVSFAYNEDFGVISSLVYLFADKICCILNHFESSRYFHQEQTSGMLGTVFKYKFHVEHYLLSSTKKLRMHSIFLI